MLTVVHDKQERTWGEKLEHGVDRVLVRQIVDVESSCDGTRDKRGVGEVG